MVAFARQIRQISILIVAVLVSLGCAVPLDEQAQQVIEEDPVFADAWQKKQAIQSQVASLEAAFKEARSDVEIQINALRDEMRGHEDRFREQVRRFRSQLDPEKEELLERSRGLEAKLNVKREKLRAIQKNVKSIEKQIRQLSAVTDVMADGEDAEGGDQEQDAEKSKIASQLSLAVIEREELHAQINQMESELRLRKKETYLIQSW